MIVDNLVFKMKENGVFLDIGANHPTHINNTYFFEKERSWTGLAFEPIKSKVKDWKIRKTPCLQIALGSAEGQAEFVNYDEKYDYMSGFDNKVHFDGEIKEKYKVQIRPLSSVLEEHKIAHVDFVSLDVEGMELDVLKGIDFNKCSFTCFAIELCEKEESFEVRKFMVEKGYMFAGRMWQDDLWVEGEYYSKLN